MLKLIKDGRKYLNHFKNEHIPYENLVTLVEFTLCCPGTNVAVERVFSIGQYTYVTGGPQHFKKLEVARTLEKSAHPCIKAIFHAEIVEVEIEVVSPSIVLSGNFAELNRTVTCMVLKANDRRTSCPCHDEFRGPRSDYVRQVALENNNS
ncbi:hypothetical protein TNCV_2311551 [Trichonephila clavipes]|nr:hypothetical protein TNCV_2311551 [Trichonephila clavipes]